MSDLISRDATLDCFCDWIDRYGHEHTADEDAVYQRIAELPAVQPDHIADSDKKVSISCAHENDLINRQAAIDEIRKCRFVVDAIDKIRGLPSVQSEIIRCKDCKWKQGSECVRFAEVRPFPDDFCSRAERRTDE